jgi:molybdate transport system substrate-binding protein
VSRWATSSAALLLASAAAACGSDGRAADTGSETMLTVYAAASLTSGFELLGDSFEATHDGVRVEFSFAGSSDLAAQIQNGAPADVFASADESNMDKLTTEDLQASAPQVFATNTLEIATPPDNPAGVTSLGDLADPDLDLVVCAPEVPCGAAAQDVAKAAGITLRPDSEEQAVTDVLGKVTSGEADAGLVYVTDVIRAGDDVQGIAFPESASAVNSYPITTVAGSAHADLAGEFVDLVLGPEGQRVLASAGFGPAPQGQAP